MKKPFPLEPGRLVYPKAGRDKDILMIILSQISDEYVIIANGALRKVSKPKKKKLIHIRATPHVDHEIARLYASGELLDADVRKCVAAHIAANH